MSLGRNQKFIIETVKDITVGFMFGIPALFMDGVQSMHSLTSKVDISLMREAANQGNAFADTIMRCYDSNFCSFHGSTILGNLAVSTATSLIMHIFMHFSPYEKLRYEFCQTHTQEEIENASQYAHLKREENGFTLLLGAAYVTGVEITQFVQRKGKLDVVDLVGSLAAITLLYGVNKTMSRKFYESSGHAKG